METASGNMCRCCASEGVFKDLATTYHWMGEEEIYGDMLRECFDIQLSSMENADGGICEVCITQLRNASNFKKQVLLTEEQFKSHLQNVFKPGIVKVEVTRDEGNSTDDNATDDGMSGPEFDDIPIKIEGTTKNEKEDLEIKPKKRSSVKPSTSTAKKSVSSDDEPLKKRVAWNTKKVAMRNLNMINTPKVENATPPLRVIDKHLHNIQTILMTSNATPVQYYSGKFECTFCYQRYVIPNELKTHTLENHESSNRDYMKGRGLDAYIVKLDVTGLKCRLCYEEQATLKHFIKHIQNNHHQLYHNDVKNHILPFKFDGELMFCGVCATRFDSFKNLLQHMSLHYRNYVCSLCDAAFINNNTYRAHMKRHKTSDTQCPQCEKVFSSESKMATHLRSVHIIMQKRHKCCYCDERFVTIKKKTLHMVSEHNLEPPVYQCGSCGRSFGAKIDLRVHIRRHHLLEKNWSCDQCDMKFFRHRELNMHMIKHTKIKKYQCKYCFKYYGRRYTLTQHMRIHADDRRFKCPHCDQAFVQKCSLKSHLQSKHNGLSETSEVPE